MKKLLLLLTTIILSTTAFAGECDMTIPGGTGGSQKVCSFKTEDLTKTTLKGKELEEFADEYNRKLKKCDCKKEDIAAKSSDESGNLCATGRTELKVIFDGKNAIGVESAGGIEY